MKSEGLKGLLISDFNIDLFPGFLNSDPTPPKLAATAAPFGQVYPILSNPNHECWQTGFDFAVVWTLPENAIHSFHRLCRDEEVRMETIQEEVSDFCSQVAGLLDRVKFILVPLWAPRGKNTFALTELNSQNGPVQALMKMNVRLCEELGPRSRIYLLDATRWLAQVGASAFNPKLWYMGKIPFDTKVFQEASRDIKSAVGGILGTSRKLIIVDLDDTLWGGVVGDLGYQNLKLGGHDPVGEAFVDFQKELKALNRKGILLGVVSKNTESVALEAIEKHDEMILKLGDFAGWKINWSDKVQNILELVSELNLGLQSVVFIDDNPAERDRVRNALPEILAPEWPEDKLLYPSALLKLSCFNNPSVSAEDSTRTEMYVTQKKRTHLKESLQSFDEWLEALSCEVLVEPLNPQNQERILQLINKTNQMNLATRRLTEQEFKAWESKANRSILGFRVKDKFGDMGLTGVISLVANGNNCDVVDFVLSCRVMGRKIEEAMIHAACAYSRFHNLETVNLKYIPSEKNKPCLEFLKNSGLERVAGSFYWKVNKDYPQPRSIQLNGLAFADKDSPDE